MIPVKINKIEINENNQNNEFVWPVPGSKSITNRALILASLVDRVVVLDNVLHSDDTRHMINALKKLGVSIENTGEFQLTVKGGISCIEAFLAKQTSDIEIFVGNSGTTVRFLTSLCAFLVSRVVEYKHRIILNGDEHMAKRPIKDLVDGLKQVGCRIECATGCPPLTIEGSKLPSDKEKAVIMPGNKSSQYFTSLMMSGCLALHSDETLEVQVQNTLVSEPYVVMTAKMMKAFGSDVDLIYINDQIKKIIIHSKKQMETKVPSFKYVIEADASAASYAFAAAAVTGTRVSVLTGINAEVGALQGDFAFASVLERMGCEVVEKSGIMNVKGPSKNVLQGVTEDMFNISDTVMTLAAIAPLAKGKTTIKNVANIRIKETDRLQATVNELKKLGQVVEYGDDWLSVSPALINAAQIECYSDHRMAMAFAILGLRSDGVTILDKNCVNKTYPTFWSHLEAFQNSFR